MSSKWNIRKSMAVAKQKTRERMGRSDNTMEPATLKDLEKVGGDRRSSLCGVSFFSFFSCLRFFQWRLHWFFRFLICLFLSPVLVVCLGDDLPL
jgi:hypothetical protein